jgi:glutaminyl-peptide cyclotransferase
VNRLTWLLLGILSATVIAWAPAPSLRSVANQPPDPALIPPALFAHVDVLGAYPHDTNAFTEGLVWYSDGFFESTGLNGESTLRQVAFPSSEVTRSVPLSNKYFGEGLTLVDDHLVQLTWQNQLGLIYDRDSFDPRGTFTYGSEGWGLTYDGTSLIRSDGTPTLTFLDPASYQTTRTLPVTLDGKPVEMLNELEWIRGEIWANVWQTDLIVQIDPSSGVVTGVLDMTGLYPAERRPDRDDVLNGIAYDASTDRIFITGKRWPNLYEIRVQEH